MFRPFLFSTSCGYEILLAAKILLALHDLPEIFPFPVPLVNIGDFSNQIIYLKTDCRHEQLLYRMLICECGN
jgi:hypothetical protein